MAFGSKVIQQDLSFVVNKHDIFVIMGGSGCGKSTLLRHMIGLNTPAKGKVYYGEESLWDVSIEQQHQILRRTGFFSKEGRCGVR